MLALLEMNHKFEDELDAEAVRRGKALATLRRIADDYLVSYSSELLALPDLNASFQVDIGGGNMVIVEHGGAPRIDELVKLGKAPSNFSATAFGGGRYVIQIEPSPVGCVMPVCNLEGLITIDRPYLQSGQVDYARLGIAAGEVGPDGAYSRKTSPTILSGFGGAWSTTNPPVNGLGQVSGILAARFGYGTSGFSIYYRRDGSAPLTGDLNADTHALRGVTTLNASGMVTAKTVLTTLHQAGQPCDTDEENAFGSSDAGVVMVCRARQWNYAQSNPVEPGAACTVNGTTGTSTADGDTLVCRGNVYVHLDKLIARNVQVGRELVIDNQLVPTPPCEIGGTPDNSLIVNYSVINVATVPPMQAIDALATPAGSNWLVSLKLVDTAGGRHSGNDYGVQAMLNLECKY